MNKLEQLRTVLADGTFHHATYRNQGSIWEGLYIYVKYAGLRGFEPALTFGKDDHDLRAAEDLVRGTGISFGAYGAG